jgi:AraC family transcriptional regulator, arabinose operon regulatory protein
MRVRNHSAFDNRPWFGELESIAPARFEDGNSPKGGPNGFTMIHQRIRPVKPLIGFRNPANHLAQFSNRRINNTMRWRQKPEGFAGQRLAVVPRPILSTALHAPLIRSLMPTDAGFYPKAKGHTCARESGCPETIFIYCSEGNGWCEIAGRMHEITRNQLLVLPASVPHVYGADKTKPWTIYWFHAVGTNLPLYLEMLGTTTEKPVVSLGGDVQLLSLFEDVLQELEHGFTMAHLLYAAHALTHLMGLILRHKNEAGYGATDVRERVAKSIEFMKDHLREPLKVATLAGLVSLSRSHYTTLFQRVTGYAPLSYLNHLRVQRAVQLLNTTDQSIKQISDQLGFCDQFYFSRAFAKMHNHSPSEHRRRYGRMVSSEAKREESKSGPGP